MTDDERTARNINPTPEAIAAMFVWPHEYASGGQGSMDFWDGLEKDRKEYVHRMMTQMGAAEICHDRG